MSASELALEFVKVLAWPATTILLLLVYREAIIALLPHSKVKVTMFGIEFDIALDELTEATLNMVEGGISKEQNKLLIKLYKEKYILERKLTSEEWKWIRPLMFAGLVEGTPSDAYRASSIKGLGLTPLGKIIMRGTQPKK